jgi:hypothetical protein
MAYSTGVANNRAEIVAAIKALATSNGWSETGTTLIKGDIYVDVGEVNNNVYARAALGGVGANLSPRNVMIRGDAWGNANISMLSFPCTYHVFVHTNPDNIVCFVNYNVNFWQWLMFGKALNLGVDGTCNYQAGSYPTNANNTTSPWSLTSDGATLTPSTTGLFGIPFPFWPQAVTGASNTFTGSAINITGTTWTETLSTALANEVNTRRFAKTFLNLLPNAWNGETTLVRMFIKYLRSTGIYTYAAELPHVRYTRNDNYVDGQTITIGSDEWIVFPGLRKNISERSQSQYSSGTVAIAVKKEV